MVLLDQKLLLITFSYSLLGGSVLPKRGKNTCSKISMFSISVARRLRDTHSLDTKVWSRLSTHCGPLQRFDSTCIVYNNEVFAFGGCDNRFLYGDLHTLHLDMAGLWTYYNELMIL